MASYDFAPAGIGAAKPEPGDFLLTRGDYWSSKIIRLGQRLRYSKAHSYYNHAALVIDDQGGIAEALGDGVVKSYISKYQDSAYYLVKIEASEEDREQIVRYADSVLAARYWYGWLTIVSVGLSLLTGGSLVFARASTAICSGFVSDALVRAGYIFPKPSAFMIPADLAEYFDIPIGDSLG
ncbi:MAG: hypothetical protein M3R38_28275 [Actinomycetota bacterium]|nr:hypothetical protein [Actinomycetota bacterium]